MQGTTRYPWRLATMLLLVAALMAVSVAPVAAHHSARAHPEPVPCSRFDRAMDMFWGDGPLQVC